MTNIEVEHNCVRDETPTKTVKLPLENLNYALGKTKTFANQKELVPGRKTSHEPLGSVR